MASGERKSKHAGLSLEELDILDNKVALALAKHDEIVNGWIKASNRPPKPPIMTDEEIEAQISSYGPGAGGGTTTKNPAELGNKLLRAKFIPSKTLKASKARDADEKAASAKRGLTVESSDEEEGRSSLGKAKKHKQKPRPQESAGLVTKEHEQDPELYFSIREPLRKAEAENGNQVEEIRAGKSMKRKSKSVAEEPIKKAKLEDKPIIKEPEPAAEAGRKDDMDIDIEKGSESTELKVDAATTTTEKRRGAKEDPKEAKRLKKKLKREKKKRLQAEVAALASKV